MGYLQALGFAPNNNDKISSWNFIFGLVYSLFRYYWGFGSYSIPQSVFLTSKLPEGLFLIVPRLDFARMAFCVFSMSIRKFADWMSFSASKFWKKVAWKIF